MKLRTLFFLPVIIAAVFFYSGCAGTVDTANMSPDDRFKYAQKLYDEKSYELAIPELDAILLQFGASEISDDAQHLLAMCRYQRKEYLLAASEFSRLIKNMPASPFLSESQFMLADCYYQLSPSFALDQRYTRKGIEEFQAYIDIFKTSEKVAEAEKKIKDLYAKLAEKEFNNAYIYEKLEYYTAALQYYQNVVELYYDTPFAPNALYKRISINSSRGKNKDVLADITLFLTRYPGDKRANELKQMKTDIEKTVSGNN